MSKSLTKADSLVVAAIDVGLKRIGTALRIANICLPQNPIIRKNRDQAASEVAEFLKLHSVTDLVVGIPAFDEEMSRRICHFVSLIKFDGNVIYEDESMSSEEAKSYATNSKRDGRLDSMAAKIILERWAQKHERKESDKLH